MAISRFQGLSGESYLVIVLFRFIDNEIARQGVKITLYSSNTCVSSLWNVLIKQLGKILSFRNPSFYLFLSVLYVQSVYLTSWEQPLIEKGVLRSGNICKSSGIANTVGRVFFRQKMECEIANLFFFVYFAGKSSAGVVSWTFFWGSELLIKSILRKSFCPLHVVFI